MLERRGRRTRERIAARHAIPQSDPCGTHSVIETRAEMRGLTALLVLLSVTIAAVAAASAGDDSRLRFEQGIYSLSVSEDFSIGETILRTIVDKGPAKYSFRERDSSPKFGINETSGDIFIREHLDRETKRNYTLIVVGHDYDIPPRTAMALVRLFVVDVNDNAPRFVAPLDYHAVVVDDDASRLVVDEFACVDADEGRNAELEFEIESGNDRGLFKVLGNRLVLARPPSWDLCRSSAGFFRLGIFARDKGKSPVRSINTATVWVEFECGGGGESSDAAAVQRVSVCDDGIFPARIGAVASSAAERKMAVYTLVSDRANEGFRVERESGRIWLMKRLNRRGNFLLVVNVADERDLIPYHYVVRVMITVEGPDGEFCQSTKAIGDYTL